MSIMYCEIHGHIDTDYNAEHFTSEGECVEKQIERIEKEADNLIDEIEKSFSNKKIDNKTREQTIDDIVFKMNDEDCLDMNVLEYLAYHKLEDILKGE